MVTFCWAQQGRLGVLFRRARPSSNFAEVRRLWGFRFESAVAIRISYYYIRLLPLTAVGPNPGFKTQNLVLVIVRRILLIMLYTGIFANIHPAHGRFPSWLNQGRLSS